MSNHSELRALRSKGIHFKNKYKFMTIKITLIPQIKEACIWSNVNRKSTLQYPFEFCSDVSFIGTIFSRNWHLFTCAYFINFIFNICVLAALIIGICSTWYFEDLVSYREWKQLFTQIIKHIWRTNWMTSGHETTVC